MPDIPPRAMIKHEILVVERVVLVQLGPAAHFRHMVTHFRELIRAQPALAAYDYVCDLTAFRGDAFQQDVSAIADEYSLYQVSGPTYTCFATSDPFFGLWAKSMDDIFGGRRHLVFPTVHDCLRYLEQERRTR